MYVYSLYQLRSWDDSINISGFSWRFSFVFLANKRENENKCKGKMQNSKEKYLRQPEFQVFSFMSPMIIISPKTDHYLRRIDLLVTLHLF